MSPRQKQMAVAAAKWLAPFVVGGLVALGYAVKSPGQRMTAIEARQDTTDQRLTRVEEMHSDVDAMALSLCLGQRDPIARQALKCGVREQQAGIRR